MPFVRYHLKKVNSTNIWAKEHLNLFKKNSLTVITAQEQTEGKGRGANRWISEPNTNITLTFCFFVPKSFPYIANTSQLLALCTAKLIENLGLNVQLKWPNDILISEKKVAGILCETVSVGDKQAVILGLGLNVNMEKAALDKIEKPATSLKEETKVTYDLEKLILQLQNLFLSDLNLFLKKGFAPFFPAYKKKMSFWIGRLISFHDRGKLYQGMFHSINDNGSLNLQLNSGKVKTFFTGDID